MWFSPLILALASRLTSTHAQNITIQEATQGALVYGYPLLAFRSFSVPLLATAGVNELEHARFLSTAANRSVVKPNVDTLYSTLLFDLSSSDLIISVPDIPSDRYALFSYYDPFGGNFANTGGSGNFNASGDYLLRVRPAREQDSGLSTTDGGENSSYAAYIDSPTTHGILIIRWLVDASSYEAVHALQDATAAQTTDREEESDFPALSSIDWNRGNSTPAEHVLNLLAQLSPANPPELVSELNALNADLTAADIVKNAYNPPLNLNLSSANTSAIAAAGLAGVTSRTPLNNGWSSTRNNLTGNFGTNYAFRTAMAAAGYLGLRAPNAVYPSWTNASTNSQILSLGAEESYIYTFSRKPPLQYLGFWSLTAYGEDNFLIDNPLGIYARGDRSNLTYASGQLVYGGNTTSQDGPFQILIQVADIPPPANWTSNWLPGPSGGGNLSALLRWYGAEAQLLDGTYEYPVVSKQAAIRGAEENGTAGNGSSPAPLPYTGTAVRTTRLSAVCGFAAGVMVIMAML